MKYLAGIFGLIVAIFIFTINADKNGKEDEHNEHHYITEKPWHLTTKYPTTEKWWHQNTRYPWYYTTEKWWHHTTKNAWQHTTGKLWYLTTKKQWHHTTEKFPSSWDHNHDHNNDNNHDNTHDHNHDNNHYQNHDNVHAIGLAPDPHSCHHFFSYGAGGTKYRLTCPSGTLFDKNLLICNHKYLVDC